MKPPTNLAPGTPHGASDLRVYVRDQQNQTTEAISVSAFGNFTGGAVGDPTISDDGRYVAFACSFGLVAGDFNFKDDVHVRDRLLGTTTRISVTPAGTSGNGRSVAPSI